jgi:hypothetical protein
MKQLLLALSFSFVLGCAEAPDDCETSFEGVVALNCPDAGVNCIGGLLVLACAGETVTTSIDCALAEDGYPMAEFNTCGELEEWDGQ